MAPRNGTNTALQLALCALVASFTGCSLVSLSELDAGSGGGGAATSASIGTSNSSASSAGGGGAGGEAPSGTCVPPVFHVGFEEDTTAVWSPSVFEIDGDASSSFTSETVRAGQQAWLLDAPEGETIVRLRHRLEFDEGESYWFGFSQSYLTPATGDGGTMVLWLECAQDPWIPTFRLWMDPASPGLPFSASIYGFADDEVTSTLDEVVPGSGFNDWVLHFVPSSSDDGAYVLYREGEVVHEALGSNLPPDCGRAFTLRVGITRYTTNSTPRQAMVLDELRLLRGDHSVDDALYTLDPDSGCP